MSILKFVSSLLSKRARRRNSRRGAIGRLRLEALESRDLLTFEFPVDYGPDLSPYDLVSGDFNGDGRLDLAMANGGEHSVALLGNGDGSFQPAMTSSGFFVPETLWSADVNGDGNDDLLTIAQGANLQIAPNLLLSNGDGTFQPPQAIALWGYALDLAVGDFDGDSNMDLAVGASIADPYIDTAIYILLGHGDGDFHNAAFIPVPSHAVTSPGTLHAGDFNNDGQFDLVSAAGVLPGNGDGTFQELVPGRVIVRGVSEPLGDFNRDGNLDVLAEFDSGDLVLQLGNGDGTFQPLVYLDGTYFPHSTAAGDVNADGNLDVVLLVDDTVYDEYGYPVVSVHTARVRLGNGDGSFTEPIIGYLSDLYAGEGTLYFASSLLADFDGDGLVDLAATEIAYPFAFGHGVHVMHNDGDWTPQPPPPLPPYMTINDVGLSEGNVGSTAAVFTVTLSKSWDQPVTVAYATADGDAIADSDYVAASGTLTIPAGETSGTIEVVVIGDRTVEGVEAFRVNLSDATDAVIADAEGWGSIVDDEPRVSLYGMSKPEGKRNETTLFTFTVTLSASYDEPVTMSYRTEDGTAKAGEDYVAKSGTLTFAPGETMKTVTIEVKGDNKKEDNEGFYLVLSDLSSNAAFSSGSAVQVVIWNDDNGGTGGKKTSTAAAFDAAIEELMFSNSKKRS